MKEKKREEKEKKKEKHRKRVGRLTDAQLEQRR